MSERAGAGNAHMFGGVLRFWPDLEQKAAPTGLNPKFHATLVTLFAKNIQISK
jgi:hypothetical protein